MKKSYALFLILVGGLDFQSLQANLPVMNTLPRWNQGYGLQINYEYQRESQIYEKDNSLRSRGKLFGESQILEIQGVISFEKEYRLFFGIPWQTQIRNQGSKKQRASHIEEIFLGGAFKKYYNLTGQAASVGLAPLFHWSNTTKAFRETNGGFSLSLLSDIETYYFLGIASLQSKISFAEAFDTFLFEETLFIRAGYHLFHINANNIGSWLSLGVEGRYAHPSENFHRSIFTYAGFSLDVVPNLMVYWNNYLLHILVFVPAYRYSIGQSVTEDFRIQVAFGGAFLYL